jgi:hypothetical protein
MNIKSPTLWGSVLAITAAGIYGIYLVTLSGISITEGQANSLYSDCMVLQATVSIPSNIPKAKALVSKINNEIENIEKTESLIPAAIASSSKEKNQPIGYAQELKKCATGLDHAISEAERVQ